MKISWTACFAVLALVVLLPTSATAQHNYEDYRALISQIDQDVERILRQRKANHQAQQTVDTWMQEAGGWIEEQQWVAGQLLQAKQRTGHFATMTDSQLQAEVKMLQNKLAAVSQPPQGRNVGGKIYYHLQDIYKQLDGKKKETDGLQSEDHDLTQKLLALDAKRDAYARNAEIDSGWAVEENDKIRNLLQETHDRMAAQVNDPSLWCEQQFYLRNGILSDGPVICRDAKLSIIDLTMRYRNEMIRSGKPFNQAELVEKIKKARDESVETKRFMRDEAIPQLQESIQYAVKVNQQASDPPIELAGCWFLLHPGGRNHAAMTIEKDAYDQYTGIITDYGWIGLPKGHVLFRLKRVNATTFDGTEFSIINQQRTQTPLRIIVDRNRQSAGYRTSDDMITLRPCN
jgi:hypothetical protein